MPLTISNDTSKFNEPTSRLEYLVMGVLFVISGNPAIDLLVSRQTTFAATAIILLILVLIKHKFGLARFSIFIFFYFLLVLIYQTYSLSFFSIVTFLGFFVRLLIAFLAVRLIGDFMHTYISMLFIFSILSLMFYIPQQIANIVGTSINQYFEPLESILGKQQGWRQVMFFHTYILWQDGIYRNAGMFWEPGAFAGYLTLGLVFLALARGKYSKGYYRKRFCIFILCLLTTMSTVGYVAMPFVLFMHFTTGKRFQMQIISKYTFTFVILMFVYFFVIWNLPFVKGKIERSIIVTQYELPGWEADRIGTILFDLEYISRRPLTGWGLHMETRHALHPFLQGVSETGRGNGFSDFIAKLGIPAMFLWIYLLFKYLFLLGNRDYFQALIGTIVLIIILNGECYLNYPLFLCFFFLANEK